MGIKFLVDLDSRTGGINSAIRGLHDVGNAAQAANEHLRHSGHEFSALTSNLFKADVAAHIFERGFEKAFELAEHAVDRVVEGVKEAINVMAGAQREELALTNLLGDRGEAREQLEYLEKFASLSEFNGKQTKSFAIELQKAGYHGAEFRNAMELVADAASLSSDKLAGAQDAISSLSRMQLTGKVDSRTLKGLGLDARDILGELQHTMGVGKATLAKMIKDGSLPAEKAFDAVLVGITKKTHKGLGEAGMAMGEGLEAKLTHLRDIPERIFERLKDSPVADKLGHLFDKALEAFDPDGPKGRRIVAGVDRLLGSVGDTLDKFDWDSAAASLAGIGMALGTWIDPLSKVAAFLLKITEVSLRVPKALVDLGERIGDRAGAAAVTASEGTATQRGVMAAVSGVSPLLGVAAGALMNRQRSWNDEQWEARQAALSSGGIVAGAALPDISRSRGGSAGGTGITATAHVTVDARGHDKPEEVGEAVKEATKHGMTKALETHTIQKGLRPARAGGH
jgi:tape measure domain-containing protein